jgi:signal recognition particle subunit SRP54
VAGRILGAGDIVSLVEKAAADFDQAKAEKMAKKLSKGQFDLDDLAEQLRQMQKLGGMQGIMGMLPGVQKIKKQIADANISDKTFKRQEAIITSMTKLERRKPDLLNASRKRRVAAGAGVEVQEINRLLKQHRQMADAFKAMSRDGGKSMARMAQMMGMGGGAGGMPPGGMPGGGMPSQADLAKMMGGAPGGGPTLSGLSGLGGGPKLPGLGGGGLPGLPFNKPKN